jgi:hypothetical protein
MRGVSLPQEQMAYLQLRYDVFLDRWHQLQARIALSKPISATEVVILIPPHHEEAMKLYAQFEAEAVAYLGADAAQSFLNAFSDILAARSQNYGEQERQIVVTKNTEANPPVYSIEEKQDYTGTLLTSKGLLTGAGTFSGNTAMLFVGGEMGTFRYLASRFP